MVGGLWGDPLLIKDFESNCISYIFAVKPCCVLWADQEQYSLPSTLLEGGGNKNSVAKKKKTKESLFKSKKPLIYI